MDGLDAARAFALILGIVYHACGSFTPTYSTIPIRDVSTDRLVEHFMLISHSFRMELFFLLAGFFGYVVVTRKGAWAFARARAVRIGVPFIVGWILLHPLITSAWLMGADASRGDYDFWRSVRDGVQTFLENPRAIYRRSHLWFLYYLALLTGITLVVRAVACRRERLATSILHRVDAAVRWLAQSPFAVPLLAIPTTAVLLLMKKWGVDTPNQSLRPYFPAVALYGGFFVVGWLLARQRGLIDRISRLSPTLGLCAIVGIVGSFLILAQHHEADSARLTLDRVLFDLSYACMMWSLVLFTIGTCMWCFPQRAAPTSATDAAPAPGSSRAIVRYVADSSYWLYLAHYPIVMWLQVVVAEMPLHWAVKLAGISIATIVPLLIAYDLLVRSTIVGQVLNGRRKSSVIVGWVGRKSPVKA